MRRRSVPSRNRSRCRRVRGIADALALAAADQEFLGVDLGRAAVGIFGKVAPRDQLLKEGDRIEIYRPLLEEPKLARRKRASRKASKPGRS